MSAHLALIPEPARPPKPRRSAYWENRGPRDWRPVTVTTRYGHCLGGSGGADRIHCSTCRSEWTKRAWKTRKAGQNS